MTLPERIDGQEHRGDNVVPLARGDGPAPVGPAPASPPPAGPSIPPGPGMPPDPFGPKAPPAVERPAAAPPAPKDTPKRKRGGGPPADGPPPEDPPDDPGPRDPAEPCPVVPLGTRGGQFYFLTPMGQFRGIASSRLNNLGEVAGLFEHRIDWLEDRMPRFNKDGERTGWHGGQARDFLIAQCSQAGLFEPGDRVREQGCWAMDNTPAGQDQLIVHLGDELLRVDASPLAPLPQLPAGQLLDGNVYPATARRAAPDEMDGWVRFQSFTRAAGTGADADPNRPGQVVLDDLMRWNFARGRDDAVLVLGWIACAFYGGALSWRPAMWIGAKAGAGKTTLRQYIEACLGDAMTVVTDTTAAALRQMVARQSKAVMVDELENNPDKAMALQDVVKIIRLSSTRGQGGIARGSAEQVATISHIDAIFLALSIRRPPLLPQDAQRIAKIELEELTPDQAKRRAEVERAVERARGFRARLFGRMLVGWETFRTLRALCRAKLIELGRSARFADQYGALYAGAATLLANHATEAVPLAVAMLATAPEEDMADQDDDADEVACLTHLLASEVEGYKAGERRLVGELVARVFQNSPAHEDNRLLRRIGLTVMWHRDEDGKELLWLGVANKHPALLRLFEGTQWAGKSGASSPWVQSLQRFRGHLKVPPVSFGATKSRAILILDAYVREHLGSDDARSSEEKANDAGLRT